MKNKQESATYFEVFYHSATGEARTIEVAEREMANCLAKELAQATGRRTIVTKRRREWNVYLADTVTGEVELLWSGKTKQEVLLRWELWKERKTQCVLLACPEWATKLTEQIAELVANA